MISLNIKWYLCETHSSIADLDNRRGSINNSINNSRKNQQSFLQHCLICSWDRLCNLLLIFEGFLAVSKILNGSSWATVSLSHPILGVICLVHCSVSKETRSSDNPCLTWRSELVSPTGQFCSCVNFCSKVSRPPVVVDYSSCQSCEGELLPQYLWCWWLCL